MLLKNNSDFLEINILKRDNTDTNDYWDANWLEAKIQIVVQGFTANYETNLRIEDLQRFYEQITKLQENKSQEIEFSTMEEELYLKGKLKSTGILMCDGEANNQTGNILRFKLNLDDMSLNNFAQQLRKILQDYPIIRDHKP